jgi:hypothetical protein
MDIRLHPILPQRRLATAVAGAAVLYAIDLVFRAVAHLDKSQTRANHAPQLADGFELTT